MFFKGDVIYVVAHGTRARTYIIKCKIMDHYVGYMGDYIVKPIHSRDVYYKEMTVTKGEVLGRR